MLSDYQDYLKRVRNSLIQCGVEFPIEDIVSYRDTFVLGEKIEELLYFYSVLEISGSGNRLQDFILPIGGHFKEKMRSIFYKEYLEVAKSYSDISKKEYLRKEGINIIDEDAFVPEVEDVFAEDEEIDLFNDFDVVENSTEGRGSYLKEEEYVSNGKYLDEDTESIEDEGSLHSEESDAEIEYVSEGKFLDDDYEEDESEKEWGYEEDSEEEFEDTWVEDEESFDDWGEDEDPEDYYEEDEESFDNWGSDVDESLGNEEESIDDFDSEESFDNWGNGEDEEESIDDWGSDDDEEESLENWGSDEEEELIENWGNDENESEESLDEWGYEDNDESLDNWGSDDEEEESLDNWGSEDEEEGISGISNSNSSISEKVEIEPKKSSGYIQMEKELKEANQFSRFMENAFLKSREKLGKGLKNMGDKLDTEE